MILVQVTHKLLGEARMTRDLILMMASCASIFQLWRNCLSFFYLSIILYDRYTAPNYISCKFFCQDKEVVDLVVHSCMPVNPSCMGEPCPAQPKQVVKIPTIEVGKEVFTIVCGRFVSLLLHIQAVGHLVSPLVSCGQWMATLVLCHSCHRELISCVVLELLWFLKRRVNFDEICIVV